VLGDYRSDKSISFQSILNPKRRRRTQNWVQALGIMVFGVRAFGVTCINLNIVNQFYALRVPAEHEDAGLNLAVHGDGEEIDLTHVIFEKQCM
jgi:ammonia channel protein AmtB